MIFSIVIPCYNEAATLPLLIERCREVVEESPYELEFILVDNGSTDNTHLILKKMLTATSGCRFIRLKVNEGYGHGILAGLAAARGNILGWTHADMQTDPGDVLKAMPYLGSNSERIFAKGRRFGRPVADVAFTICMSIFETFYLGCRMWDINAQPNLFHRSFFETWQNPPHDFALDLFVYAEARSKNLDVFRFPVKFGNRLHGISNWNVDWRSKLKFIRRTIEFSREVKLRSRR